MPEILVLGPTHLQLYLMCSRCKSHIIWRSILFVSMQQCRTNTAAHGDSTPREVSEASFP